MIRAAILATAFLLITGPAFAACSGPAGEEGIIIYNKDHKTMQFCDGTIWWSMKGVAACPSSGLVGHWKLNETSGTTAADSAGSNDGTLTNMDPATDWVAGKLGNALDLDGSDDKVELASNIVPGTSDFSYTAWIKTTAAAEGTIMGQQRCASVGQEIWALAMWNSGHIYYRLGDGDELHLQTYNSQAYNDGQWHHVAVTLDRDDNAVLYIDRAPKVVSSLATISSIDNPSNYKTRLGAIESGCGSIVPWNGQIDDVRIFNRALTPGEVSALYNSGAGCQ